LRLLRLRLDHARLKGVAELHLNFVKVNGSVLDYVVGLVRVLEEGQSRREILLVRHSQLSFTNLAQGLRELLQADLVLNASVELF
jgi:hypothetical protein